MSSLYYSQRWQESIADLLECVNEENYPLQENQTEKGINYKRTDLEWFQFYAGLYIRYLQTYQKLEDAYDQMVHPQKRILMKKMLENVIVRMCQVKQLMIRYSTQTKVIQSDFINIDEILMQMKLTPKALEVPIPRYFLDKQPRNQIISSLIADLQIVEEDECYSQMTTLDSNLQTAIRIIQKLQRGRQGISRGIEFMKIKNKQSKERASDISNQEQAKIKATILQKYWRAFLSRRQLANIRNQQMRFLGMVKDPISKEVVEEAEKQRCYLKMVQHDREKRFQKDKIQIKKNIKRTEQHSIESKMKEQRRKWIQKFLEMHEFGNLPNNVKQFYDEKENQIPMETKEKKKEKKEEGKKGKKNEVEKFIEERQIVGPTESVLKVQDAMNQYGQTWAIRDSSQVNEETYDTELARDKLRPQLEDELEKMVDAQIALELDIMRVKYGIKKKKDKKRGKKKPKQKKVKIPLGLSKIAPKELLEGLFQKGIAKVLKPAAMNDFLGDHNSLTHLVQKNAQFMPDPSFSQIRQVTSQYIGIPLGSQLAKEKLQKWKWFLFYGAIGTGKTMIIRALARQTNSLVFDLTPQFVKDRYQQKSQLIRLLWSVIICAKQFQPSIIMIDEFQTIFSNVKSKKKECFGPKMKKIMVDMKKNKFWGNNDRICVIGCTNRPYEGSIKEIKKLFDKKIYFPYPNYATRKLLIENFIQAKINQPMIEFPYDTFASITEGFTSGSLKQCIEKVMTELRIQRLADEPLKLSEFISPLSNTVCVYSEEYQKICLFTDEVMGFKQRREIANSNIQDPLKDKKNIKK